jgi:hypothetical protein
MSITNAPSSRKHALIAGLAVQLPTACGCGSHAATIGEDATALICICSRHRNPLSERARDFLERLVAAYGAPDKPIILRRNPD